MLRLSVYTMKIVIERDVLLGSLQLVNGIVERRQTMPILSNVLLELSESGLALTTTDLEILVQTSCDVVSFEGGGRFTVPARKLFDLSRALPSDSQITIEVSDNRAVVKSGRSKYSLQVLPASGYPTIEGGKDISVSFSMAQSSLKCMVDTTLFAMASQDVRYYLNGMMFEVGSGTLKSVATDGHRMAVCEQGVEVGARGAGVNDGLVQVIVPRKTISELSRLLSTDDSGTVLVDVSEEHISLSFGGIVLRSKLIDGTYPDYNRVIPRNLEFTASCQRAELRESLSRAAILSNEKLRSVRLTFEEGTLEVEARNSEQEEAEEVVEIEYDGPKLEMGFNVNYLLDAVGASKSDSVEFKISGPAASSLLAFSDLPDNVYVVMPMRL